MYIYVYICIYMYIYSRVCTCIRIYMCISPRHMCMYVYVYMYVRMFMYVWIYDCMYICISPYTSYSPIYVYHHVYHICISPYTWYSPFLERWDSKWSSECKTQFSMVITALFFQTAHLKRDMNFDHRGFRSAFRRAFRISFSRELAVHCSVFLYQATRATMPHANTHTRVKRDLRKYQKRPVCMSTDLRDNAALRYSYTCQKRPT